MNDSASQSIIPGLQMDRSGQASIDAELGKRLIDLAIALEPYTPHPVDVQHVVAAIIQAVRSGELRKGEPLPPTDAGLCSVLAPHVDAIFERYSGRVAREDEDT
jgi:hypothetical protein